MNIEDSVEYLKNCLNDEYNFKNATRKKDKEAIETLLTAYEKEKEKNDRYFKQNIEYQKTLEKLQKETVWKDKIKEIIYPTPDNPTPLEIQESEMYKKLLKEVEEAITYKVERKD